MERGAERGPEANRKAGTESDSAWSGYMLGWLVGVADSQGWDHAQSSLWLTLPAETPQESGAPASPIDRAGNETN